MNTKARNAARTEALRNTASALNTLANVGRLPDSLRKFTGRALARASAALKLTPNAEKVKPAEALKETASALQQVLQLAEQSTDRRTWPAVRFARFAMHNARAALGFTTQQEAR